VPFEARHRSTGDPLHVLASYYPVPGANGEVAGVGAVVRDVTRERRAEDERARLLDRLRRLQAATAALARARTTDEVARAVLTEVPAATGATAVSLSLVDDDHLEVVSSDGYVDATLQRWRRFPVDADVPIAEAVRTGTIVTAGSREEILARWPSVAADVGPGERSLAALPLQVGGEVIGAIGLSVEGSLPDEDSTSFLESIASQASQALRRATLAESDRVSREHLAFLADATVALTASLDLDLTLARLAELTIPRLGDWCAVHLVGPDGIRPLALAHADDERLEALQQLVDRWPVDLSASRGTGAVIRTGEPELYDDLAPELLESFARDDEHLRAIHEAGFTSGLVVPIQAKRRTLGALALGTSGDRRVGPAELDLAREVAARAGQAMLNAELFRERTHIADVLQRSLLPPDEISVPGLDVAARFVPVGVGIDVGGDFYDAFRLGSSREPSDSHAVVVGDVCGKGSEAAAIAGAARHTIRATGLRTESPSTMLHELNEVLLVLAGDADAHAPRFCTAVVAVVTPTDTGARVTVSAAGHPLPMLQSRDGTARPVGRTGSLLGVVDDPLLHDVEIELLPGEALILYTDGVTERHAGDRFFDEEGLAAAVSRCAGFTAEAMAERIELAARAFVEDEPRDDLAIVVLRVPGRTGTSSSASTELPVDASAPRLARRFVSEVLAALGRDDLADDGALLASEIVTNAVLHGEPPLRVSVEPATDRIRLTVTDAGTGRPEPAAPGDPAAHGKGLQLVERVAERWGVEGLPAGGKSVWFDLA
jgi:serine phosphatase RsbU (regulator of sigma subunit)/anti-sigma regulatory factor (Ser/Thr protein kinase)